MKGPSVRQVALKAGVSPATVTRALRGDSTVASTTRDRVTVAASEIGYVAPSQPRVKFIGVLAYYPERWFFANMITRLERQLSEAGYTTVLINLADPISRQRLFDETLQTGVLQGLVVIASTISPHERAAIHRAGLPAVVVGGGATELPRAGIDDAAGGRLAIEHLVGFGHRDIGVIALDSSVSNAFDTGGFRRSGVLGALKDAGIKPRADWMIECESTARGGATAAEELLSRPKLPTAIFVMSDEMATGALWTLRRAGIDVPGQISVIGFDDADIAECVDLTTIRQSVPDQASSAARMLVDQINDGGTTPADVTLPIRLVIRGTTGPRRRTNRVNQHAPREHQQKSKDS